MASALAHGTVQPNVVSALSQLSSLFHGVKSLHSSSRARKPHKKQAVSTTSEAGLKESRIAGACDTQSTCSPVLDGSFAKELAEIEISSLNPILTSVSQSKQPSSHWRESHVSAQSFFENKTGFPESHLRDEIPTLSQILSDRRFHNFLRTGGFTPSQQQTRGFKTKRSGSVGIGIKRGNSVLEELRNSVDSRLFPSKDVKHPKSFKKMLTAYEHNPEFQSKLKVSFAEGYHAEKMTEKDSKWGKALRLGISLCLAWFVFKLLNLALGGNGMRERLGALSTNSFLNEVEVKVTFDDVKGMEEAKQELQEVVEFLKDPDKFRVFGAKLPKGVLLVGPPGIGKTMLARAVAGEAGVPFFHASGSEFEEMFVGLGAARLRQLFKSAKERSPSLIFIDEIDSVGAKRTSSQIHPHANQTINQLLSEMDGFSQNEGVIVIGATNRKDNLDKAILRPGRFDVEVRVYLPDMKGRQEILEYYISKTKNAEEIDVEKLARGTTGFTGADLENMVNQAALRAAMDGADELNMSHMEFARDKVLMGPAKKSKIQDEETNWMTAYHEAGHTLVAYFTKDAIPLHKVTIIPRGMSLGQTSFIHEKEQYGHTRSQLLAQMDVSMGGRAAEEVIYGVEKVTTGASNDFQGATSIATAMVKKFGMSEKVGMRVFNAEATDSGLAMVTVNDVSPAIQEQIDAEIKRILQESYDRAKQIIRSHQAEHKALAKALMKHETLDKNQIKAIIEGKSNLINS